jgi:hypothetical protein
VALPQVSGTFSDSGLAAGTFNGANTPKQVGSSGTTGALYMTSNFNALPTVAKVGDSGTLGAVTGFSHST